jgi:hypothetical protein
MATATLTALSESEVTLSVEASLTAKTAKKMSTGSAVGHQDLATAKGSEC